jgi:hypothetical protein
VSSLFFFSFFFLHTMEERPKVSIKVTPKKDVGIVFTLGGDGSASSAVTSTISLRNKSAAAHLAFKVKTNNADKFWVEPKSGFIEPGATVPIRVELRPDHARSVWDGASDPRDFAKDRFLIQSVSVLASEQADMGAGSEEARSSAVNAVFQNADPKTVLNTKRSVSVEVERGSGGVTATEIVAAAEALGEAEVAVSAAAAEPTAAPPATPARLASAPAAASLVGMNQGIKRRSLEEQIMMGSVPVPAPRAQTTRGADEGQKLQALRDRMTMLKAKEAEFLIVINEKTEQNGLLRAKLQQAEEQLAQSVEAHREARRENNALRKAAQNAPSIGAKTPVGRDAGRTKRDATNPGAWIQSNNSVLAMPAIGVWPLNEVSPYIAIFVLAIAMLVSWSVLVNNVF